MAVIMFMLVQMGVRMLMGVGMAVGSPLVGMGMIVLMAVLVFVIVGMFVFSFHGSLLSQFYNLHLIIVYSKPNCFTTIDIY
jgi:hypothetical protein